MVLTQMLTWKARRFVLLAAVGLASASGVAAQPLPTDRLARVLSTQQLRVCVWPDYYGISYRNAKTLVSVAPRPS